MASHPPLQNDFAPDLPPDFDPQACPILAAHYFGLEMRGLWWRQHWLGHRLPAERGVILIAGGRS